MIIKKIKPSNFNKIIFYLNKDLKVWKEKNYFSDNFQSIGKILDRFLNKILWNCVKRFHSRRSNSWIYKKYWKNIAGNWRFFFVNQITGKINFLLSHNFLFKPICDIKTPLITNTFKIINSKKVFYNIFKKIKKNLTSIFSLIYNKQKGLCYKCRLPIITIKMKIFKVEEKGFILIHNKC